MHSLENGLARTPQMGWNTWNHFGCDISEETILGAAKAIVDNKLNELGYNCKLSKFLSASALEFNVYLRHRCHYGRL